MGETYMKKIVINTDTIELTDEEYNTIFSVLEGEKVPIEDIAANIKNIRMLALRYPQTSQTTSLTM